MAASVRWRLERLEKAAGPRATDCGECGNPVGRDGRASGAPRATRFRAYFPGAEPETDQGPAACPGCGRVLRVVYRAEFDRARV